LFVYDENKLDTLDHLIGYPAYNSIVGIDRSIGDPLVIGICSYWGGFIDHLNDEELLDSYIETTKWLYEKTKKINGFNAAKEYLIKRGKNENSTILHRSRKYV